MYCKYIKLVISTELISCNNNDNIIKDEFVMRILMWLLTDIISCWTTKFS